MSFNAIKIILICNLHHVGVNVRCYSVNKTLNWCSHSCKNLHFFSVTITPSIFLCRQTKSNLSDNFKEENGLYVSHFISFQFISFRSELCRHNHLNDCKECPLLIKVAVDTLQSGVCEVSKLYRKHFSSTYRSSKAVRRFMQLPVVTFRVGQKSGMQKLYVDR